MKKLLIILIITTLTLLTIFFAISKISIKQHISQHQYQQQTQIQKNENVNLIYQDKFIKITNEIWEVKHFIRLQEIIDFINTLSYYQQTRMIIVGHPQFYIFYPVIKSNTITVTNFNKNSNKQVLTNDIRIKYPFTK